jgi:hypothetical protein
MELRSCLRAAFLLPGPKPTVEGRRQTFLSGDAFGALHKDGKALGLPVTLVVDKDGCALGVVEGGAKWDSAEAQR